MPKLILASKSIHRKKLLENLGLNFEVKISNFDESTITTKNPIQLVTNLAIHKALKVWEGNLDKDIISADTVMFCDGVILGKPKNLAEAKRILLNYSNNRAKTITGNCIIKDGQIHAECTQSEYSFGKITYEMIDKYIEKYPHFIKCCGAITLNEGDNDSLNSKHYGEFSSTEGLSKKFVKKYLDLD